MSSLESQLKKLQIPDHFSQVASQKFKKKPSILFDAREAADIDNDTVFFLGINGLQELISIDGHFEKYENNLFNETSKNFERTLQTQEANDKLSNYIGEFLQRLSPYFLLKPAQKTLEWLIRRFRIHVFNIDELFACILPYHETKLFVRVLQVISLSDTTSRWHWLKHLQKSGSPLARETMLRHCITEHSFLSFVCDLPFKLSEESSISSATYRVLFSFYATTVVGILEITDKITEQLISHILPYVFKGLKSGIPELKVASFMIIAQLGLKCSLEEQLITKLLEIIAKSFTSDSEDQAMKCLAFLYHKQSVSKLPKKAFKSLCQDPGLIVLLEKVHNSCDISDLLEGFFKRLVTAAVGNREGLDYNSILESAVKKITLGSVLVIQLIRDILGEFLAVRAELDADSLKILLKKMKSLIKVLERRYPVEMDKALEAHLEEIKSASMENENQESALEWTQEFISMTLSGVKYEMVQESETSLVLGLHHPQSGVRQLAVRSLVNKIKNKQNIPREAEFLQESILARLDDDDPGVVEAVLQLNQDLTEIVPKDVLLPKLFKLLERSDANWSDVLVQVMSILVDESWLSVDQQQTNSIAYHLLPHLLLTKHNHVTAIKVASIIAKSALGKQNVLLEGVQDLVKNKAWTKAAESADIDHLAAANRVFINWLSDQLINTDNWHTLVCDLVRHGRTLPDGNLFSLLLNCAIGRMISLIPQEQKLLLCSETLPMLINEVRNTIKHKFKKKTEELLELSTKEDSPGEIPLLLISNLVKGMNKNISKRLQNAISEINLHLLLVVIQNLPPTDVFDSGNKNWCNFDKLHECEKAYLNLVVSLFELLADGSSGVTSSKNTVQSLRYLMKEFIKVHFNDNVKFLHFLSFIWSCDLTSTQTPKVSALLQIQSLYVASVLIGSMSGAELIKILNFTSTIVPSLLVPLTSPIREYRAAVIKCLAVMATVSPSSVTPATTLVSSLNNTTEELQADCLHLKSFFGGYFSQLVAVKSPEKAGSTKVKAKKKAELKVVESTLDYLVEQTISPDTAWNVKAVILNALDRVTTQSLLLSMLPILEELLTKMANKVLGRNEMICVQLLLKKFTPETVALFQSEPTSLQAFHTVLSLPHPPCAGYPSTQITALNQINQEFFSSLPTPAIQQAMLKRLVDLLAESQDPTITSKVKDVFFDITLGASLIITELLSSEEVNPKKEARVKRIRRTIVQTSDESSGLSTAWQRVTVILELLQHKTNITNRVTLVPTFFNILARCLEMDIDLQPSFEYIKQLLLDVINSFCQEMVPVTKTTQKVPIPVDHFNVELVVQAIRTSENPQTHHQALLLLATAAQLFPEKVLHNIMSVFTFMGANVLRQDDSYSFHVINRTVETVIPALIQAAETQKLPGLSGRSSRTPVSLDDVVAMVTRVFVDASPHIPEHRRLPVFTHLAKTLGPTRFLHLLVVLVLERFVVQGMPADNSDRPEQGEAVSGPSAVGVEFCLSLCLQFEASIQMECMINVLKYLSELPEDKPEDNQNVRSTRRATNQQPPLFNYFVHSAKHFRQFKFTCLGLIPALLGSAGFITKVVDLEEESAKAMESLYLSLLELTLKYITATAKVSETHSQDNSAKFWRAMVHRAYETVEKLNTLLPASVFLGVISQLVHSDLATVRRKAMELLNNKLTENKDLFTEQQTPVLLLLVDELLLVVSGSDDGDDVAINRQTALYSLKLLARMLAKENPQHFKKVVSATVKVFSAKGANSQVSASALLCLAELCSGLGPHLIPCLPEFMPPLLKLLRAKEGTERNSLLLLSASTALYKAVECVPHFLSPYLLDILIKVTVSPLLQTEGSESSTGDAALLTQLVQRLEATRKQLASSLEPRVLLPAISQCYQQIIETNKHNGIILLMELLSVCISSMNKDHIKTYTSQLLSFFLVALDFRVQNSQMNREFVLKVENSVIDAFLVLVMKLSETSFRPMFLKLLDWATRSSSSKDRLLVFYHFVDTIAGKMKSLFVLFAGYIVKNAATLLDENNFSKNKITTFCTATEKPAATSNENGEDEDEEESDDDSSDSGSSKNQTMNNVEKTSELLGYVIGCLHKIFLYDTHGFLNKEKFDLLMQPLVDQLENEFGGKERYQQFISEHLVSCLGQFAVALGDEAMWKPLNYQILLKTRHSSTQVRFAGLKIVEEYSSRLGEEFMVLLPETIPFLAELMEDESFEVEQQCQHVISQMEIVLGESLQKYFE